MTHGDVDIVIDHGGDVFTAESVPGAGYVIVEGTGHALSLFYGERWADEISAHSLAATHT